MSEDARCASCCSAATGEAVARADRLPVDSSKPFFTGVVRKPVTLELCEFRRPFDGEVWTAIVPSPRGVSVGFFAGDWFGVAKTGSGSISGSLSSEDGGEGSFCAWLPGVVEVKVAVCIFFGDWRGVSDIGAEGACGVCS